MPVDAQTAQAYFAKQSPEVQAQITASTAGNPNGILDWFTNAVNSGDPGAGAAAGGTVSNEGNQENEGGDAGTQMPWQNAAEPDTWLGKRKPTPAELRKWANQQHQRYISGDTSAQDEDYNRYSDRVLAHQIENGWNVSGGWDKGWGTPGAGVPGQGKPGGGGGGGGGKGGGKPAPAGATIDDSYLQNKLLEQFETQGGLFTRSGDEQGMRLDSGGIWSSGAPAPPPAAAVSAPGAPAPGAPATGMPATGGIDPLVGALANTPLFSGGGGIAQPGSGAITSMGTKQATPGLPGIASNPATKTTQPGINTSPIESALARKNPTGEWWRTN